MTNGSDDSGAAPLILLDDDGEPAAGGPQGARPAKTEKRGKDPDRRRARPPRPLLIEAW